MVLAAFITTTVICAALYMDARPLAITVESGRMQFEPAYIRLRVRVEPHPDNRALAVGIVGPDFETSSLEQLDGDKAPITRWRDFKDVPAGEYQAIAHIVRVDGSEDVAQDTVTVIGRGF